MAPKALKLVFGEPIKNHFTAVKGWLDDGLFGYYGTGWGDNQTPFNEGKVAMWLGSSGSFGGIQKTVEFPFSATYLPYWDAVEGAGTGTFIGGGALFAMSGKPEEENKCVASFFEYLTSPEVQYMWHRETGYVPITNAAYDLAKKDGHYDRNPAAEVGIKQLTLPGGEWTKGYRMGFYVQIRDIMNREYGKILPVKPPLKTLSRTLKLTATSFLSVSPRPPATKADETMRGRRTRVPVL
jgi:sn-glycerol 3-phosphate transport system substrate-binding protein